MNSNEFEITTFKYHTSLIAEQICFLSFCVCTKRDEKKKFMCNRLKRVPMFIVYALSQ